MCLTCLAASFFIIFSGLQGENDGLVRGISLCLTFQQNALPFLGSSDEAGTYGLVSLGFRSLFISANFLIFFCLPMVLWRQHV